MHPLDALDELEAYSRLFTDVKLWALYARAVLRRHGLEPDGPVTTGVPGTCPVFLAGGHWVIKFFGRLFEGGAAFAAEREAARLATRDPGIPMARIAAAGELAEIEPGLAGGSWPWPYLVFEYVAAKSLGEQLDQVSDRDRLRIAAEMGGLVRRLHDLPLDGSAVFPDNHRPYLRLLQAQRAACVAQHRAWGTLPPHLIEQIEDFLPPPEALLDRDRPPHLIHADLTRDHLLGRVERGGWRTLALIDFGDAMTGSLLYELVALHLDLFGGDKRLLKAFLDAYGLSPTERVDLPRRALATALLHRFNVLSVLPDLWQQAAADPARMATLDDLAGRLWETGVLPG